MKIVFLFSVMLTAALSFAADPASSSAEARTAHYFQSIRKDPNQLLLFLREMPKGGDLHSHLVGAIYAESFIQWAADGGLCVDEKSYVISPPPCASEKGTVPAGNALSDPILYREMIDAYSMRNWQFSGKSGHDHFFDSFDKFLAASFGNTGKMLAETASRAAAQREIYQELMHNPAFPEIAALAGRSGWTDDFARQREKLLAGGMADVVAAARKEMDEAEATRDSLLHCASPEPDPGCKITQRYLHMVLRGFSKEMVFAQILLGFELASADPRFVGINLVQPEDWYVPRRDFRLQLRMVDYLHGVYPNVHIALHAGELAPGLVPAEDMSFHIRSAVETGHAERIGHGVDVLYEKNPRELLRELAQRNVMVEICLTSNAMVLGVHGDRHPLAEYLNAQVPVALATDDEGVARSDMTQEFMRGAIDQNLSYTELKKMVRTSLEHSFVSGESLWSDGRSFIPVSECAADLGKAQPSSEACRNFLQHNEKAKLQWTLEEQFQSFESQPWPGANASVQTVPGR